jgi:lantibiotic modifying enzyme
LDLASLLGEELLGLAVRRDEGWSWDTMGGQAQDHLTGFSHGTSGIAWALLELFDVTGDERFRRAGLEGFRYERHWYDPQQENWPDLRDPEILQMPRNPNAKGFTLTYPHLWCHGAPGIGLARLRGWQITGEEKLLEEARAAIRSTRRDLENQLPTAGNYSLCHGISGNAELSIYGSEVLGNPSYRRFAEQVGLEGLHRHGRPGSKWPSGMMGGPEAPNLMLGFAGTGYFYLRLYDSETPSVLILPRCSDAGRAEAEPQGHHC